MLFDFLSMANNYEQRKVANTEINGAVIDTCAVTDSTKPYETGICHPAYNGGRWVIVEEYSSKEEAQAGHDKWVLTFTDKLPSQLTDVGTSEINQLRVMFKESPEEDVYLQENLDSQ